MGKARRIRAAAWLHTIHYETGEKSVRVTLLKENPWGVPGRDYSEEYVVTSEALIRRPPQK